MKVREYVEQIFEGYKIREALFRILIVGNSDVTDFLLREVEFQVVVHHHMLTSKAG